jgi:hypothetical protein
MTELAHSGKKGNGEMNWIRRAWRFIVDRPLV